MPEMTISLVAIVSIFVILPLLAAVAVIILIWLSKRAQLAKRHMIHEEIEKAIEHGATPQDIEQLARVLDPKAETPRGYISRMGSGIAFIAWGVGLAAFFLVNGTISLALLLGIPLTTIGVFRVITAKANNQSSSDNDTQSQTGA